MLYNTFMNHLDDHIGLLKPSDKDKKEEFLERLASLQARVVEVKERVGSWVEWVRRACEVGEEGMQQMKEVREEVWK